MFHSDAEDKSEITWSDIDRELFLVCGMSSKRWKIICKVFSYDKSLTERLNVGSASVCWSKRLFVYECAIIFKTLVFIMVNLPTQ
jgi:hypothetical protein